ncbi:MAG TPA: OmpH family outer membrane protein [Smithella sp.]|nr:OmpH family outer membrane protein [Smithella sp.]
MKHLRLCLIMTIFFLLFIACPAVAAKGEGLKIGVVDIQKVMQTAKAAKTAQTTLEKEFLSAKKTLDAKGEEIKALEEELKESSPQLSPKERQEKQDKLSAATRDYKRLDSDLGEEFQRKVAQSNQSLLGEIREVINTLRKQDHYTLIFGKDTLLSHDGTVDVTEQIIRMYDQVTK